VCTLLLLLPLLIARGCRYTCSQLVEVNAHSLFSKWFSESGKLVSKLFGAITELVEEPQSLVFVLIDEVESLTAARKVGTAC
jgi:SpoVK/Ycf46/Vps4 family AAA+-type ATPase